MDQGRAPILDKLVEYSQRDRVSFHVPGHKFGRNLDVSAAQFLQQVMSIDYTEITGLDDLHQPHGVIEEAQHLAAECFKAETSFFLVNGSTVGNLALILSVCERDDLLIVQRNVHKSVLHGLMLAGARAVFLQPRWDESSGAAAGVRAEDVESALVQYPQAKAVLLSNPNYYGMGVDLQRISAIVHVHRKPLLVDEAHGAHFGFHPEVPESAMSCGADGVVQSTHKMLTALTMGAMLHLRGDLLQRHVVQQRLSMLQSSSPSYPIMASLDACRRFMAQEAEARLTEGLKAVNLFKQHIHDMAWFGLVGKDSTAYETQDPFKVVVRDRTGTLTGYELQKELENYGCMIEMADPVNVMLCFSLSSSQSDSLSLIHAFRMLSKQYSLEKKELLSTITNINKIPRLSRISSPTQLEAPCSDPKGLLQREMLTVALMNAAGYRSAEMVIPYPPGIPLLYPGERITSDMVEYLQKLSSSGASFQGIKETNLKTLEVYK